MKQKLVSLFIPILLLTALVPGPQLGAAPAQAPTSAPVAQAATPFLSPAFQRVWTRTDQLVAQHAVNRSWYWGPQANTATQEYYKDAPGGMRLVQYFDKSRME